MKPYTRTEKYLNAIATGVTKNLPAPKSRLETFLSAIAKKPRTAVDPSVITDAVNEYLDEHPVSGADVPTTDIDFSNWDERGIN